MKWEKRLAVLLVILIFIFGVRSFLLPVREQGEIAETVSPALPEIIGEGQEYYPVYFSTKDAEFLIPEFRAGKATIEQILRDLESGPRSSLLVPVLPMHTKVLSYTQQGSILFVNFSHHLVTNHPGGSSAEILTVYGIVNSLVGIANVEKVQILVNNERLHTLVGHLLIDEPLSKDYSIIGAWGN